MATSRSDRVGHVEEAGVDYLPENERDSSPGNLFAVFLGSNLGWTVAVYGWVAVQLGLDFRGAVLATVVGTLLGAVVLLPLATISPRTGTNMTVSSGAFFGIRGRLIGSGLSLVIAIVFAALTVWTSGDALVATGHRLVGLPNAPAVHAVAYAIVSAVIVVVALFGHATIVAMQKFVVPIAGTALVLGFLAFSAGFDPTRAAAHPALGGYAQTFVLAAVLAMAGPLSYAPVVGDYTRRISLRRHSARRVRAALFAGLMIGMLLPAVLGAFVGVAVRHSTGDFMGDLVGASPLWFVVLVLIVSIAGGFGQGVLNIYATGLDLETFFPRLRRVHTTALAAAASVALLYVGVFVFDALDSITAATVILNGITAPWVVVILIGALRARSYDPHDLQAFAQGRHGGRYWFRGGWNVPAVVAWFVGSVFGVLSVDTTLYRGPLAGVFGGVDPSALGSGIVTAVVYGGFVLLSPRLVDPAPEATPAVPDAAAPPVLEQPAP
ncbi:purine-cytosine permease family protein [Microbacterium mangrovi]|uniref:purine-cytosine permease family protein n=1 Tax=Microbacterium mangrovi TaxID=1348253 RepID=UPI0006902F30|nr:cytosine permease [Microbacterium mangrovi]